MAKNHSFGKKNCDKLKKNNFELKKIENFDQKVPKKWFFGKKSCVLTWLVKIFKNIAQIKHLRKPFLELCLNMIFRQF